MQSIDKVDDDLGSEYIKLFYKTNFQLILKKRKEKLKIKRKVKIAFVPVAK